MFKYLLLTLLLLGCGKDDSQTVQTHRFEEKKCYIKVVLRGKPFKVVKIYKKKHKKKWYKFKHKNEHGIYYTKKMWHTPSYKYDEVDCSEVEL